MIINPTIKNVTDRITKRSETTRSDYLEKMNGARILNLHLTVISSVSNGNQEKAKEET